ncbi:helix-turn-helix domain-containing protein [Pelobacter propionicus]|uniref:Transcriptional regulator, XRE family n=1 Tax=Pelobacter propionicus (strain DSM 2379 / NBRC 103807 / OttBd1) TaxID=338966 RepID=A1AQ97_PELPD|nr:helix-turn-helix transcriptional regulator [Pelobacter propionicus]ABK99517.1 transcriptional regulator, XRE family [Pelobacter propionicus DSM 2379]
MRTANELLGLRIRELRKRAGMTQEQLAELLGIDQKHMSRIELGKSYPSLDRLLKIAVVVNAPLPNLFEFGHMNTAADLQQQVVNIVMQLGPKDLKRIYRILEALREG